MESRIISGVSIALQHEEILRVKIKFLRKTPHIVSILVGDDKASELYSNLKKKKAGELGINFELIKFSVDSSFEKVVKKIEQLNLDESIHGIMVQLPLPVEFLRSRQIQELLDKIAPQKDVDGLTGKGPVPQAAVKGILSILESEKVDFKKSRIVVIGAKGTIGSELVKRLKERGALSVEEVDKDTKSPEKISRQADVLISVVGQKNLVTTNWIKPKAIVIDVGGDVDFENVREVALRITPPRGGVGPMTVISLMENAVELVSPSSFRA